ncbi:hypothetical protein JTB14_011869 [Gonioctena quinquepunctata]|nr:hypothetical protein JTB14_011869 [Gonioctena quinquepunctata]
MEKSDDSESSPSDSESEGKVDLGEIAIGVKRNLPVVQADLDSNRLNNTKAIGLEVNTQRGRFRLVSVYNPTSILSEDALDSLIDGVNTPTILAGDFNADHVSWNRVTNPNCLRLRRHCDNSNYMIEAPARPTHHGANRPDNRHSTI